MAASVNRLLASSKAIPDVLKLPRPCSSAQNKAGRFLRPLTACANPSLKLASLAANPSTLGNCQLESLAFRISVGSPSFQVNHAGHDALCTLAVFAGSFAWVRLFDILVQKNVIDQKLSRKLVHISTGIIYALLWPMFSISPWSRYFALAIPFANALKLLVYGLGIVKDAGIVNSMSRSGSSRELLSGPLCYVVVLSICTVFFWRESPVGMVALAIMCGGDGIADIIGRRLGSIKLPYNPSKSWVGSISMFVFSFLLSVSLLYYYSSLGFYHLDWSSAVQTVALISFAATIVESLPISTLLDDNMSVPLVSVLLGSVLFPAVVL